MKFLIFYLSCLDRGLSSELVLTIASKVTLELNRHRLFLGKTHLHELLAAFDKMILSP